MIKGEILSRLIQIAELVIWLFGDSLIIFDVLLNLFIC